MVVVIFFSGKWTRSKDFMLPGQLTPGAEQLLPNIRKLTDAARQPRLSVSHGCYHTKDDPEFAIFPALRKRNSRWDSSLRRRPKKVATQTSLNRAAAGPPAIPADSLENRH
jgi:hypothetical protein